MHKTKLYYIAVPRTDLPYEEQAAAACQGGADGVLLDDRALSPREMITVGQKVRDVCRKLKIPVFMRSRADLALAVDADGLNLQADDIPVEWARQILGPRRTIGVAAASLGQALELAKEGADFISVGPIFSDAPGAAPLGVDIIRMIKKRVKVQVVAFGGITLQNVADVITSDADAVTVALPSGTADDIRRSIEDFQKKVDEIDRQQEKYLRE
jgi:thiamine-phosphate pyrophosphorylase